MAKKKKKEISIENLSPEQQNIALWLQKAKFKKKIFGGVDEADVWKKIEQLNALYTAAVDAERIRYDTLLEHYINSQNEENTSEMRAEDEQ